MRPVAVIAIVLVLLLAWIGHLSLTRMLCFTLLSLPSW